VDISGFTLALTHKHLILSIIFKKRISEISIAMLPISKPAPANADHFAKNDMRIGSLFSSYALPNEQHFIFIHI